MICLYGDCYAVFIVLLLFYIYFNVLTCELVVKLSVVAVVVRHLQVGKARG